MMQSTRTIPYTFEDHDCLSKLPRLAWSELQYRVYMGEADAWWTLRDSVAGILFRLMHL